MRVLAQQFKDKIRDAFSVWTPERKLRWTLYAIGAGLIIGLGLIVGSQFSIGRELTSVKQQQAQLATVDETKKEAEKVSREKVEQAAKELRGAVNDNTRIIQESLGVLKQSNPKLNVPQVVEEPPAPTPEPEERKGRLVVKVPPPPAPTASPQVKTKTIIRYKPRPTPWPWWKARPTPKPRHR
jgi:hypothetical protein